jgi:hypothetical protein
LLKAFGPIPEARKCLKIDLNPTTQDEFGL